MKKILNNIFPNETVNMFKVNINLNYIVGFLIVAGVFLRVFMLGVVPGGMNQDEAFAGYEAYSLLNYGVDSYGYSFPVYFMSWGSGMNVLNSYLMVPFMALFGVHDWVVRLPQVLVACVSLYVFYRLFARFMNNKIAVTALAILAICPWHIMLSRWGLESNLAPGFLLFGAYAFFLGKEKAGYYVVSAVCYGLSLYCYATIWAIVPFILLLQFIYLLWIKEFKISKYVFIAIGVLALLALPLILFFLVNKGYIEEMKIGFISVPKLLYMRASEISIENIPENIKNLWNIMWKQNDDLLWNSTAQYGLYYKGGFILALCGMGITAYRTVVSIIKRKFDLCAVIFINLLMAIILGCLVNVNINRINCIHIWNVACIVIAIYYLISLVYKKKIAGDIVTGVAVLAGTVCIIMFSTFYFGKYNDDISWMFNDGLEEAVEYAKDIADDNEPIYVSGSIKYSKVMYYDKISPGEYKDTVVYNNFPAAYLEVDSFGRYIYKFDTIGRGVYIFDAYEVQGLGLEEYGFTVEEFGNVVVASY